MRPSRRSGTRTRGRDARFRGSRRALVAPRGARERLAHPQIEPADPRADGSQSLDLLLALLDLLAAARRKRAQDELVQAQTLGAIREQIDRAVVQRLRVVLVELA